MISWICKILIFIAGYLVCRIIDGAMISATMKGTLLVIHGGEENFKLMFSDPKCMEYTKNAKTDSYITLRIAHVVDPDAQEKEGL